MTVTLTVPDELAERLRVAAAARGMSVERFAVEILGRVEAPAHDREADAALEAFLGANTANPAPFEIHEARRELAERRHAGGNRHL